jgi:hypothetical protein
MRVEAKLRELALVLPHLSRCQQALSYRLPGGAGA